jgi:hypothetical protein
MHLSDTATHNVVAVTTGAVFSIFLVGGARKTFYEVGARYGLTGFEGSGALEYFVAIVGSAVLARIIGQWFSPLDWRVNLTSLSLNPLRLLDGHFRNRSKAEYAEEMLWKEIRPNKREGGTA